MSYRPLCCYCGKTVDSNAWDHESGGWFSYGGSCMMHNSKGRFVAELVVAGKVTQEIGRYSTMGRAQRQAEYYTRSNLPVVGKFFVARDLGVGEVSECQPDRF